MKAKAILAIAALSVSTAFAQTAQPWMSSDVSAAWAQGYKGQGVRITVVDDYTSANKYSGNLGLGSAKQQHGFWTSSEASLIAPSAEIARVNWGKEAIKLDPVKLDVVNLSYALYSTQTRAAQAKAGTLNFDAQQSSIIAAARNNEAVVVKAAGNDKVAIGTATRAGAVDVLNSALIGTKSQSTLFVGDLAYAANGKQRALASYSNTAGTDPYTQSRFLVAYGGSGHTGLYGTSFAAPVVAGYAAILGSKFTTAAPSTIANQLLKTARTDTIVAYNPATHGRGEASLSRALAPVSIR